MAFFSTVTEQYAELWKAVIRPPRDNYAIKDLGPTVFSIENRTYQRTDLCLTNPRGMSLACSHFEPVPCERVAEKLPCVVYLHGNCSSRLEAVSALPVLLPFHITVFCFDFAGSGLSDGEYISLGYYERDDLLVAVNYLRESSRVTCIGLWGRSMGAATALMHADRDPSIAGLVLDSPFSDLKVLCEELVDIYTNNRIPRWVTSIALNMVRSSIKTQAGFDIMDLVPLDHVHNAFTPALFAAAYGDNFIKPHHAKALHEAYAGDKNFIMVEGDHNSARSKFFMDSVAIFFFNTLQCPLLPQEADPADGAKDVAPSRRALQKAIAAASGDGAAAIAVLNARATVSRAAAASAQRAEGWSEQSEQRGQQQAMGLHMRPPTSTARG